MFEMSFYTNLKLPAGGCATIPLGSSQHDTRWGKHQASDSGGPHNHDKTCPSNLPIDGVQQREACTERGFMKLSTS